jgi:hypothetical protein
MPSPTLFHRPGCSAIIRGGKNSFRLPLFKRWLPTSVFDKLLSKTFGLDRFKPD